MKRFLAIFLSALMLFSTMSVTAIEVEDETPEASIETPEVSVDTRTNVALNRPVFTSWTADVNEPDRMVDGDIATGWVSGKFTASGTTVIDGSYIWALVDLGTEYTIDEIKITVDDNASFISRDRQNYSVYVTNTRPETNIPINCPVDTMGMTEVYTAPSVADTTEGAPVENVINVANIDATQGNKYRYVFLQKSNVIDETAKAAGGTGMGHWFWKINDLQVLTSDDVAEDAPYWIEVAKNRPAFAGETYQGDTYAARNAIDGNVLTAFIASDWGLGIKSRFVIDLEKEYPIEAVVYTPRYNDGELHGFEIYATNDNTFEYMAQIHKQPLNAAVDYGHLYYETPEALSGKKYRYIVVQADDKHNYLGINDIKVYTSDITAEKASDTDRSYIASVNCAVTSDLDESASYPLKNLTDLDSATACLITSTTAQTGYLAVDLVKPQTIDYVTYALEGFGNYHYGMEVVAANKPDLSDGVVMYSAVDDESQYFCPISTTDTKGILLFPATEEMEGKKFRYAGIRFPRQDRVRGGANLFEVYTKGSNLGEAMSSAEITKDGYAFTLTIKDFLTIDNNHTFVGAVYDTDGRLLEVKTAPLNNANQLVRNTADATATIDFADSAYAGSNVTVKLMFWEAISTTIRPVLEAEYASLLKVAPEPENVALGKSLTASRAAMGIAGSTDMALITDGRYTSDGGSAYITGVQSLMTLDLEADYAISKVIIDAVKNADDAANNFTKNIEVWVSDMPANGEVIPSGATKILEGSSNGWSEPVKTIELDETIDGRYVIIAMTAAGSYSFRIAEVEVWGVPTGEASYDVVESSAAVTSYYYMYGSQNGTNPTATIFTDGYSSTVGGRGQQWDIAWIDLGEAKAMDMLRVQVNDAYMAVPSTPMVFYVTNDEPGAGAAASIAENGKFVVPSSWIAVNGEGTSWTKNGISEATFNLPEGANYRYVACTSPTRDLLTEVGMSAYVAEITPFVLETK